DICHHGLAWLDIIFAHAVLQAPVAEAERLQEFYGAAVLIKRQVGIDFDGIGIFILCNLQSFLQHEFNERPVVEIAYESPGNITQCAPCLRNCLEQEHCCSEYLPCLITNGDPPGVPPGQALGLCPIRQLQ